MSNQNRTYGYCRISDKDQNEARQVSTMIEVGVDERFILLISEVVRTLIDRNTNC